MDILKKDDYYVFDDVNQEIIFKRHDMPTPWMNYLSNGKLFTMISQAGGNLSWYRSPQIWRIGKYGFYNLPTDMAGMFIYIKDLETGEVWNPNFIPRQVKLDDWHSAHGLGYTRFYAKKDGVEVNLKCFIGKDNVLCYDLKIKSATKKNLYVYCCKEMCMLEYLKEVQFQQYCKQLYNILYDRDNEVLRYHYFADMQQRPDETPDILFASSEKVISFDADRAKFTGNYRGFENPKAILDQEYLNNTELKGGEALFGIQNYVELGANEEKEMSYYLATFLGEAEYEEIVGKIRKGDYAKVLFNSVKKYWDSRIKFTVDMEDKKIERLNNVFGPLQAWVNFLVHREISFYATGTSRGMGYRDGSQDCLANIICNIDETKQKIKVLLSHQYNSGRANKTIFEVEKRPDNTHNKGDQHLWLNYTILNLIKEEGSLEFLNEVVPYYDGGEGTVLEHLEKAVEYSSTHVGSNGLPLIYDSDWNDILCWIGVEGRGESVFISQQLVICCRNLIEIYKLLGRTDYEKFEKIIDTQTKILNDFAWDGEWYVRATTDDGLTLGTKTERCGKIWVNSQSWAVMSETASEERANKCMDSALKYLDSGYGLTSVYPPLTIDYPYEGKPLTVGQPGVAENGGVFCHANAWVIIAFCMLKRNEDAYKILTEMLPDTIVEKFGVDTYRAEPYIYSSNIRGPLSLTPAAAGVSWLTGTASWMVIVLHEYIFGIKPQMNGLQIKPCITNKWEKIKIKREFRGTTYNITIDNTQKCGTEVSKILVDGKEIEGDTVYSTNKVCDVLVVMGK